MLRRHPRCELCRDYPEGFHCWVIECVEAPDDDESFDDGGYDPGEATNPDPDPLIARCRHCKATAKVCPECDGDGIDYESEADNDRACPTCEGWGVLPPGGKGSDSTR